MDLVVKYNNQTAGRDRLFRLLQYGSRLLWWLAEQNRSDKDVVSKLKNLEYSLSTGRKLLRLGRSVDTLYGALSTMHLNDLVHRLTLTMSRINLAVYLFADHLLWLGRVGLSDLNKDKWSNRANRFWLFSILLNLIRDIYEIVRISVREVEARNKKRWHAGNKFDTAKSHGFQNSFVSIVSRLVSKCLNEHQDLVMDTVKNGCDVFIPLAGLGYVQSSPGFIGLCGVISSLIGILTIVNPQTKLQPS